MNKQTCELVKQLFLSNNKTISIIDLSSFFSVSERTIYKYLYEIKSFLSSINMYDIIALNDSNLVFTGNDDDAKYISFLLSSLSFSEYYLSSSERFHIIISTLAFSDEPIKIGYFERALCVSHNTIINDLREIKKSLKEQQIGFIDNNHNGIKIECNEKQKRNIFFDSLNKLNVINDYIYKTVSCNPFINYFLDYFKLNKYCILSSYLLDKAEANFNLNVPDKSFYKLLFKLAIIILRIDTNHCLISDNDIPMYAEKITSFSKYLLDLLKPDLEFNINEMYYLVDFISNEKILSDCSDLKALPAYFSTLVYSLLQKLSFIYKIDFLSDTSLYEYLNAHVASSYHRIKYGESLLNPYFVEVKSQYGYDFEQLRNNIYILENGLNISFNDEEVSYILMHILASIERNKSNTYLPRIVVSCNAGIGTGNLLATLIKKHFKVNVIAVCSTHCIEQIIQNENIDLLVSTIPIEISTVKSIVVNAILNENDYSLLRREIAKIESQCITNDYPHKSLENIKTHKKTNREMRISELINDEMIFLNKEVNDWKEAIICAGEVLLWNNKITVNYLHKMVELIMKYGPYIVVAPGIAIAHASPNDGSLCPGFSLITLKKSVTFGKSGFDPISIVIACSTEDSPEFASFFVKLMNVVRHREFLSIVKNSKSNYDLFNKIKDIETMTINE